MKDQPNRLEEPFFKRIYIETTNVCNLSCSFCPSTKRKPEFMTPDNFKAICERIKGHTKHIYLHLMGEPLLHPNLIQFCEIAKQQGLTVQLTTNGTLLKQWQGLLSSVESLRQINISLSSFEANTLDQGLVEYLDQVCDFVKKADEKGIIISLRLWNLDSATLKGDNLLNESILKHLESRLEPGSDLVKQLETASSAKLLSRTYVNLANRFSWPDIEGHSNEKVSFCHGLKDHIGILVDGSVVPCCLDHSGEITLGNINETSLRDILNSDRAKSIRNGFMQRIAVEPLCQSCGYASRF